MAVYIIYVFYNRYAILCIVYLYNTVRVTLQLVDIYFLIIYCSLACIS